MKPLSTAEIEQLQQTVARLQYENEQLKRYIAIGKSLGVERNAERLIPMIMTEISKLLNADRSTLFLLDLERMELWTKFAEGLKGGRITIALKMGIVGCCVLTKKMIRVANAYEDARFNPEFDHKTGFRTESVLAAPLFDTDGTVTGAVELLNKKTGLFTTADEDLARQTTDRLKLIDIATPQGQVEAKRTVADLRQKAQCARGSLFLIDRDKGMLHSKVCEGLDEQNIYLSLNLGIAGLVAITGQALNIQDAYSDPRFDNRTDQKTGYHTRCILGVPVKNLAGDVLGVMQAINKAGGHFDTADIERLEGLAGSVAISLENAMLFDEQDRQFRSILEVMAASIDAKDHLTAGHSKKVTQYAIGIAMELGFGEKELDVLGVAALLHDYGKLGIDDKVLKKPGKLTPQEYSHIQEHVKITRSILDKMHFARKYRLVPLIAASHHERLDGSGYAEGRRDDDIPFMAKILAVADVFEALTAKRHYHEARSAERAFEILEENSGTHFDPNIVAALKAYWPKR
jgi:HD-GYP domain-containing protein (c-di-GMP phosphodiesterase class II)